MYVSDNDVCINYGNDSCCVQCDDMYNPQCSLYESYSTRIKQLNTEKEKIHLNQKNVNCGYEK